MNEAHDAIRKWMAENRTEFAGHSWEIYGDPAPDPADTETTVMSPPKEAFVRFGRVVGIPDKGMGIGCSGGLSTSGA